MKTTRVTLSKATTQATLVRVPCITGCQQMSVAAAVATIRFHGDVNTTYELEIRDGSKLSGRRIAGRVCVLEAS